jgi:hypothetical protein
LSGFEPLKSLSLLVVCDSRLETLGDNYYRNSASRRGDAVQYKRHTGPTQLEKYMQFGNFDNLPCHQSLVWGLLFLILSVALACAQEPGHDVNQRRTAAAPERGVCDKKTEAVEIFSAGEDLVIQPPARAVKASSRRHKIAVRRRARRQ